MLPFPESRKPRLARAFRETPAIGCAKRFAGVPRRVGTLTLRCPESQPKSDGADKGPALDRAHREPFVTRTTGTTGASETRFPVLMASTCVRVRPEPTCMSRVSRGNLV